MSSLFTKISSLVRARYLALLLLLSLVGAIMEAVGVGMIWPFVALLQDGNAFIDNAYYIKFINILNLQTHKEQLSVLGFFLVTIFLTKNIYLGYMYYFRFKIISNVQTDILKKVVAYILGIPHEEYKNNNSSKYVNNIFFEPMLTCSNVIIPFIFIISECIVLLLITVLLFYVIGFYVVALSFLCFFITVFSFYYPLRNRLSRYGNERRDQQVELIKTINTALGGEKEIKVGGYIGFYSDYVWRKSIDYVKTQVRLSTIRAMPSLYIEVVVISVLVLTSIVVMTSGDNSDNVLPNLALFGMAAFRMMPSVNRILSAMTQIRQYKVSLDSVYDILSHNISVQVDINNRQHLKNNLHSLDRPGDKNALVVDNVSYRYPNSDFYVLKDVSFLIERGIKVAIVGETGSGKSTLADVILGLLVPEKGDIKMNGISIYEDLPSWRKRVGFVSQSVFISDDTIRRNIAFGRDDDEIDDVKINCVINIAQLRTFVDSLHEGVETIIGERGSRISGGQAQRIGIARALYNDPDVLVMDEATSALDVETEGMINKAISEIAKDKIVIIIAHRPQTMESCEVKITLDSRAIINNK